LHRTLAFAFGAFMASIAGVLFVWWNGHVDPQTIGLGATLNVLIIAVIGGLRRIEGAFVGAFAYVFINDRLAETDFSIGGFKLGTFNSLIGLIFLVIVLVSPDGLLGLWERGIAVLTRRAAPAPAAGD
jgi:branched-chain amino acid transport system permease protein